LIRNTAIEKALNQKMWLCYLGLLIIISKNRGGAYVIAELDGSILYRPIAAFQVIPYFAHSKITLPPLADLLDISKHCLQEMENSDSADPNNKADDNIDLLADD
jgi:hypothetical protein